MCHPVYALNCRPGSLLFQGVGANFTINQNVRGNTTINDLIHDAKKTLNVLIQQPEVDHN